MGLGPLPPIANMLKVVIRGVVDEALGYPWANILHFAYSGTAPSNAVCATIAGDVASQWLTHMAPECPSPTELTSVVVTDLTSDSAGEGEWLGTFLTSFNSVRYYGKFLPNSGPPKYRLTTPVVNPITISEAVAKQEIASQRGRVGRRKR